MLIKPVARRYARALCEVAAAAGRLDEWGQELRRVAEAVGADLQLQELLFNPVVPGREKKARLKERFAGQVAEPVLNLLQVLVDKNRQRILPDVAEAYEEEADRRRGVVRADVRAVHPLPEKELERLTAVLERLVGKKVRIRFTADPALLGGVYIRVEDLVYDGSLAGQLSRLEEELRRVQRAG